MTDGWYYKSFGEVLGPVSLETLAELVQTQLLVPEDEVRPSRSEEWRPASRVPGLFDAAPPSPQESDSAEAMAFAEDLSEFRLTSEAPSPATRPSPAPKPRSKPAGDSSEPQSKSGDGEDFDLAGSVVVKDSAPPVRGVPPTMTRPKTAPSLPRENSPAQRGKGPVSGASLCRTDDWYAQAMGYDLGPMPLEKLVILAQNGGLTASDRVRPGAAAAWISPAEVRELESAIGLWQMLSSAETVDAPQAETPEPAAVRQETVRQAPAFPGVASVPAPVPRGMPPVSKLVTIQGQTFVELMIATETGELQRVLMPMQIQPGLAPAVAAVPAIAAPALAAPIPQRSLEPMSASAAAGSPGPSSRAERVPSDARDAEREEETEEDEDEEESERKRKKSSKGKDDKWYCQIDGEEHGPVRWVELKRTAQVGRLKKTDLVRRGKTGEWVAAGAHASLFVFEASGSSIDLEALVGTSAGAASETGAKPAAVGSQGAGAAGPSRDVEHLIRNAQHRAMTAKVEEEPEDRPSLMEQIRANWKIVSVLGTVILLLAYFSLTSGRQERKAYQQVVAFYEEFKSLRSKKAPEGEWKALEEKVKKTGGVLIQKPDPSDSVALGLLKTCMTRYFPLMLKVGRATETDEEKNFNEFLTRAQRLTKGGAALPPAPAAGTSPTPLPGAAPATPGSPASPAMPGVAPAAPSMPAVAPAGKP